MLCTPQYQYIQLLIGHIKLFLPRKDICIIKFLASKFSEIGFQFIHIRQTRIIQASRARILRKFIMKIIFILKFYFRHKLRTAASTTTPIADPPTTLETFKFFFSRSTSWACFIIFCSCSRSCEVLIESVCSHDSLISIKLLFSCRSNGTKLEYSLCSANIKLAVLS